VGFVVPPGSGWPLPLYELALMTARQVRGMGIHDAELTVITPEAAPLSLFGPRASAAVADELEAVGVRLRAGTTVKADPLGHGAFVLQPTGEHLTDTRAVTLPRLEGLRLDGVPTDAQGFVSVDDYARVRGLPAVWAAGDGTSQPIKQGGLAAQQADVAALGIAAAAGLPVIVERLTPVLRGTLLTGDRAWHMRWAEDDGEGLAVQRPLWWPPTKVAGRHLSPYLAAHPEAPAGMPVEVALAAPRS
jgi:sulfide:quinone oxidoreductase